VQEYVRDVMLHWLRRGIDGWRLDAAYAVPAKFWAAALPAVREEFLDAWFVGEMITATTSTTWRRLAWTR
jgi:glycosidase